ncbi:hypothetical protein PICST_66392 [Scheffersomyces stipitis CBS 6054]|uniref:Uncharacterized protein n=1 Tax=Scheffersomyces stipitis (strain ATCC 58785 / CBS 6054 / NBRC 10063 / NRRL Y-11545) TaxID=322104 RepID=A3GFZ3_PICST|nr:hypothetical protein PICST_66392 [Scheffersomyces stipitis CBS 6054]EAZ63431.2 hypothetical protein PICST_66392 [Scheffersomyces stipitis CBS 6054]
MAASLREVKIHTKRKLNELEDITNSTPSKTRKHKKTRSQNENHHHHHHHHHKLQAPPSPPPQQRSPSPTDSTTSSPKSRSKSDEDDDNDVFDEHNDDNTYNNNNNDTINTDINIDNEEQMIKVKENETEDSVSASTLNSSITSESKESLYSDLNTNPDYIALTASHRLLDTTKDRISAEIVSLAKLRDFHANNDNREEIIDFFMKLLHNDLDLPSPTPVVRCPLVDWSKYHSNLAGVSRDFENQLNQCDKRIASSTSLYRSLHLFDKSSK